MKNYAIRFLAYFVRKLMLAEIIIKFAKWMNSKTKDPYEKERLKIEILRIERKLSKLTDGGDKHGKTQKNV